MDDYTPPQRSVSLFEAMQTYAPDTRSPRQRFVQESYLKLNMARKGKYHSMSEKSIALMVNIICPKDCGDAFIIDCQKQCQVAKNYSSTFWWLYKQAKKPVVK